ncbi:replication protein P [Buttiauxella gaviniae]|uniref:replication protein P n=1 Tax=Buttiauxella gaviniae TaxID=82990 RepID=UPI003C76BE50
MAQIGSMTDTHLAEVCKCCVDRCGAGNTWPPDLAEFISIATACKPNVFGLNVADVTAEYNRWKSECWRYNSSEQFPWKHPVLYHICVEMRREGVERRLTQAEMDKLAAFKLSWWEDQIAAGRQIPPVRRQIAGPAKASGPTPAQLLMDEYKRRKTQQKGGV